MQERRWPRSDEASESDYEPAACGQLLILTAHIDALNRCQPTPRILRCTCGYIEVGSRQFFSQRANFPRANGYTIDACDRRDLPCGAAVEGLFAGIELGSIDIALNSF